MKEDVLSIFTIQRRRSFPEAFKNFYEDLFTEVIKSNGTTTSMHNYLDNCIRKWPHRCGATDIEDYLKCIGIYIDNPKDEKDLLLIMELWINLLHYAPKCDRDEDPLPSFNYSSIEEESNRMLDNAEYILEQGCNMTIREIEDEACSKYVINKRNPHVDLALIAVPELKNQLLGYMDIRVAEDIVYKQAILLEIYRYMEPKRKVYRNMTCSSISEEFFKCMNHFDIRHNTESQIKLDKKTKMEVLDKLFMMAVYVIQTQEVNEYSTDLEKLLNQEYV